MIKFDLYKVKSRDAEGEYVRTFVLKHGEDINEGRLMIQRYLNRIGLEEIIVDVIVGELYNYETSDIPRSYIADMNGIYNLSNTVN